MKAAELKRKQESDKLKQQAQQAHNRLKKVSHQNAASVRRLPKRASGENEAVEKQTTSNEESQPKSEKTFRNRFQKTKKRATVKPLTTDQEEVLKLVTESLQRSPKRRAAKKNPASLHESITEVVELMDLHLESLLQEK